MDIGKKCKIPGKIDINSNSTLNSIKRLLIFTGPVAQKRFKSLREKYSREKRRQQQSTKDGSSDVKWIYLKSLKFLDPFMAPRYTESSFDQFDDEEYAASTTSTDDTESISTTATVKPPTSTDDTESISTTATAKPLAKTTTSQPVTMQHLKEKLMAKNTDNNLKNNQSDHTPFLFFLSDQLDYMNPDQLQMAKKLILDVTFRILKDT